MGWLIPALVCALTLFGLWRSRRVSRGAIELTAAALLIAVAGYAWQGSPNMSGQPISAPPQTSN